MSASSTKRVKAQTLSDVTCPFCGLACDDLVLESQPGRLAVRENGCPLAVAGFEGAPGAGSPRVAGQEISLAGAAKEAARILREARLPLFAGLATDVAGSRAVGRLADRTGGVLDHMNSTAAVRNLRVLQDGGWITTTLSEIRNRCDLLVVAGGDILGRFPRFFERTIQQQDTLFGDREPCEVIFLGKRPAGLMLPGPVSEIACEPRQLGHGVGLLRALLAGRRVDAKTAAGLPRSTWERLAERMRRARYGVLAWAAADFDFANAELTIQSLADLVKDLNRETRWAGLPLGGSEGDMTADSVHLWQTGFGMRVSFANGVPEQDLIHNSTARLLDGGEADALVWISSFNPARLPPPAEVPTIVLGHAAMRFEREPRVFIPVGTPGVDHAGHFFRTDRVVALPLAELRPSGLPSVADALGAIETALEEG